MNPESLEGLYNWEPRRWPGPPSYFDPTRGLLLTKIPFSVCANQFSIGLAQFYFPCMYA